MLAVERRRRRLLVLELDRIGISLQRDKKTGSSVGVDAH
jgi:hypothetical protein